MSPEAQSPFEQMLTSLAYGTTAGGDGGDGGRSRKKQRTTREEAMAERESRSPAAPPTPPRSLRRGERRSRLPLSSGGPAARDGTRAADLVAMAPREMTEGQPVACTSPAAEDEFMRQQHQEFVSSGVSGNPRIQPRGKSGRWSYESSPSCLRRNEEGRPYFPSRFSRCHSSVSTGCKVEHIELREQEGGDGSNVIVTTAKRKKKGESVKDDRCCLAAVAEDDENRRNQVNGSSKTKKRSRRSTSQPSEKDKIKGDKRKRSRERKVVVVSPYFASFAEQQTPEGKAGVRSLVEVVVQRRTRRKRTRKATEEDAEVQTSIDRHSSHLKPEDAERRKKKKKKKKEKRESSQLTAAERMADAYKRVPDENLWVPPFSDHELLQEFHFFDHWRVLVICMLLNRTTGQKI